MTSSKLTKRLGSVLAVGLVLAMSLSSGAEARRGGSFGSRGTRTYSAPPPTSLSPGYGAPIQRSMTPRPSGPAGVAPGYQPGYQPGYAPSYQRPGGMFGGFGGGLLGGLLAGGLIGGMMGHGFGGGWGGGGGGGGFLTILIQLAVLALVVHFALRWFRNRNGPSPATMGGPSSFFGASPAPEPMAPMGAGLWGAPGPAVAGGPWGGAPQGGTLRVGPQDIDAFARLLMEVQDAFARENYAGLRARTTPEVMSFLAEELSQNATHGRRNDVSAVRLLQQDLAEAWSEPDADYATVAMQFESIDVMRDRQTNAVVEGDPDHPTQTTEIWTFVRPNQGAEAGVWKLSAIQET